MRIYGIPISKLIQKIFCSAILQIYIIPFCCYVFLIVGITKLNKVRNKEQNFNMYMLLLHKIHKKYTL